MSIVTLGFPGLIISFGFESGTRVLPVDTTYAAYPDPFRDAATTMSLTPDPFAANVRLKGN